MPFGGLAQIVNTVGTFAVAALQNALLAHGLPLPALRRLASSAAALLVGTSLVRNHLALLISQAQGNKASCLG